jgi:hypothetical protein
MKIIAFTIAVGLFAVSSANAVESLPRARYSIQQTEPDTGTHMLKDVVSPGAIPLNRRYGALTKQQQDLLKSQYESMSEIDEPPFPLDGLYPLYDAIGKGQQKLLVRGELELQANINSRGEATSVTVFKSPDPQMTQFAAKVLMITKYQPGVCGGVPCKMQFPFDMTFDTRPSSH